MLVNIYPAHRTKSNYLQEMSSTKTTRGLSRFSTNCNHTYCDTVNIRFGSNSFRIYDDQTDFANDNANVFSITQFNNLHSKLMQLRKSTNVNEKEYLGDDATHYRVNVPTMITLAEKTKLGTAISKVVDLYDNSKADSITAEDLVYLGDNAKAGSVSTFRIFLGDNSEADNIMANTAWLKDKAKNSTVTADDIFMRNNSTIRDAQVKNSIHMRDNASVQNVIIESGSVEVREGASVSNLIASEKLDVTGDGTIGNIYTKGQNVLLHGPVNLRGKIHFEDAEGVVVVQREPYASYPNINPSDIENGKLQFLIKTQDGYIIANPKEVFESDVARIGNTCLIEKNNSTSLTPANLPMKYEMFGDLEEIKTTASFVNKIITDAQRNNAVFAERLLNSGFYDELQEYEIENKKLPDFFIDIIEGAGASQKYTQRLKKEKLIKLFSDSATADKIVSLTQNKINDLVEPIERVKQAYSNLLNNEADLNQQHKKILRDCSNSKLFYQLVISKTKNTKDPTEIEVNVYNILKCLVDEKNELEANTIKNIFEPVRNVETVLSNSDNVQIKSSISFIFNILQEKINSSSPIDAEDTVARILSFSKFVSRNSWGMDKSWQGIVNEAQDYFNKVVLDRVTANNIRLLYSMHAKIAEGADRTILDTINDPILDTIEQKEFVARYKNDSNLRVLLTNTGINKQEAISKLLMLEAINTDIYKNRLEFFMHNLSIEAIQTNPDIASKFLELIDAEPHKLNDKDKYRLLSSISNEKMRFFEAIIFKKWNENELARYMSANFVIVDHEYNINAQGRHIRNELVNVNSTLEKININIEGQSYTLLELSKNIDKMRTLQDKEYKELYFIAEQLAAINQNTASIKANTRALVYNAMQNSKMKDPELSNEIKKLLPAAEQESLSDFLKIVDIKAKEIKDKKRKEQFRNIGILVGVGALAIAVGPAAPTIAASIFGTGTTAATSGATIIASMAESVKHVSMFQIAASGLKPPVV